MNRKIIAFGLILTLLLTNIANVHASEYLVCELEMDTWEMLGITYERYEKNDNIFVIIKDSTSVLNTIVVQNGIPYVDGIMVGEIDTVEYTENIVQPLAGEIAEPLGGWGAWSSWSSHTIQTGGLGTVIITGLLVAYCPYVGVKVAAIVAGAVAGKYDSLTIKDRIRYKSDNVYIYHERQTKFYGDGALIYGPVTNTGKTRIEE